MSRVKLGISAWLVTWDHCGDHACPKERIAAILSPRLSAKHVRELVEFIYLNASFTVAERIRIMKNPNTNPYPAQFASTDGIPWGGQINCGHNPWLFARIVDNLRVLGSEEESKNVIWDERPIPELVSLRWRIRHEDSRPLGRSSDGYSKQD